MKYQTFSRSLLLSSVLLGASSMAWAQSSSTGEFDDEIVVVGTQIKGSDIAGILPVTSLDEVDIEVTGAVSGDELLASIPQLGDVSFTETSFGAGVNDARGDVGSINLRSVGEGNTLVLLNGRRLVNHPGTKAVNFTPVVTVNSNALPVSGIKRLEILRDGASAVYGSDAVAGVINTILDDDYDGLQLTFQYGVSEGTSLDETSATFKWGKNFNEGKTNISILGNGMLRNGMPASDLRNSSTEDLRPFFAGTDFETNTRLRNTSTDTAWGTFRTVSGNDIVAIGDDRFHIQPQDTTCLVNLPGGVCADDGNGVATDLRLDRSGFRDIVGDTDRFNLMAFINHEMNNGMEFFGEASYYYSDFTRRREMAQLIGSQRLQLAIPDTAYYNPFGEAVLIERFRPIDAGQRRINVRNDSFRILGGLRGDSGDWDWETAFVHTEAETKDHTNRVSLNLFQEAIARTDDSAYNPFAGGNTTDTNLPSDFNSQSTIDSFMVEVKRDSTTKLTMADAKISNPAIFSLPGGDVGVAAGVEWRHEYYEDDRDDRLDGTIIFTDIVTGNTLPSDVMGSSPTPDTEGDRDVISAFVELAVPLVSPEMEIPLVHSFDVQLAARAEDYSDVGSVLKPKIAASWFPFAAFQVRGAYSEGFRAPNLEQINATGIRRVNSGREDWILCAATALANGGTLADIDSGNCDGNSVESVRNGGPALKPENNENYSLGATFEPTDNLTLTFDWWKIKQFDLVGIFGDQNQITLDGLLRLQGSSNPNVVRANPDSATQMLYQMAGLTPAGNIVEVRDTFTNLNPRTTEGWDIGAQFDFSIGDMGDVTLKVNVAKINKFFQSPAPLALEIEQALADLNADFDFTVAGQNDLLKQDGNPDLRYTGSLHWDKGSWGAGAFYKYVGDVYDIGISPNLPVPAFKTLNLYADYTFENLNLGTRLEDVRIRLGVRNVGDKKPPVTDDFARHYFGHLHSNRGRYWYGNLRVNF